MPDPLLQKSKSRIRVRHGIEPVMPESRGLEGNLLSRKSGDFP
jgi:hypothetical protein